MPRLIDAEALIAKFRAEADKTRVGEGDTLAGLYAADAIVEEMPAVDAELARHGRWYLNEDGKWACSECENLAIEHPVEPDKKQCLTAFCPTCGAKMDLEEKTQ